MKTAHFISFLVFISLFGGCASRPSTGHPVAGAGLVEVGAQMQTLVDQTLKSGPEAIQYLSTGLFLKGNDALTQGDFATGIFLFRYLVQLTNDPFVHKKFAVALVRAGEMEEARVVLEKLYERVGLKDESVALILAGVSSALGKDADAKKLYHAILARNPGQEDACLFLGKTLAGEKKWAAAEAQLNSCQHHHPKNGIYSYYLGKMHIDRGNVKAALRAFEEAHRREPGSTQAAAALGVIHEQDERPLQAIKVYQNHLKARPRDAMILNRLVQLLFIQERYAEALPYAELLVDLESDNLNMRVKLGILYTDAKQYQKAISVFRELLQLAPDSDKILYYLGAIHQELRSFEDAIEYFARIPVSSALYQDSSFQMASMLATLAQNGGITEDKFLQFSKDKLHELPDLKVELAVLRAYYFESKGMEQKAIDDLKAVASEQDFGLQHSYYLAGLMEKLKHYDESTELIMRIIDKDPKNAHAWNFLGYSLLERGNPPAEALSYINKALAISPQDGYIRDSLGWYYYKIGRLPEALRELNAAIAQVPDDTVIAKHLAIIHRDLKHHSQARSFIERAMKNARLDSEKRELAEIQAGVEDSKRTPAAQD